MAYKQIFKVFLLKGRPLLLTICLFFFLSCENRVDIVIPPSTPQPVLNCFFTKNKVFSVHVSMSSDIFNDKNKLISSAIVRLYTDGQLLEQLPYSDEGKYISHYTAKANTPYLLEVEIEGFPTIYGADTIPTKVIPSKIKMIDSAGIHQFGGFYSEYHISFKDNRNVNNFYETYTYFQSDTILNYDNTWVYSIEDPVLLNEDANNYTPYTYPFSDMLINGENYTLIVPYDKGSENEKQQYIVFNSVSHTYYLYLTRLYKHLYNQTGRSLDFMVIDAGNPIDMYSNITNGLGIFAAYQSHIIQVN